MWHDECEGAYILEGFWLYVQEPAREFGLAGSCNQPQSVGAMASGGILDLMNAPVSSPDHKKARADGGSGPPGDFGGAAAPPDGRVMALTTLELTRLVLHHDRDLRQLQASLSMVLKYDKENTLAASLLTATKHWQQQHTSGRPHPMGACGTAVGTVLLQLLHTHGAAEHKGRDSVLLAALEGLLSNPEPKMICKEISLCSCRLNAKKNAVGQRPVGALVRKARNQHL